MKNEIIRNLPPDHPWGQNLIYFDCIESTNTMARELAKQGAPSGTVLIADRQTGGRGRMGRSFHSPGGMGIYFSQRTGPVLQSDPAARLPCSPADASDLRRCCCRL